MLVGTLVVLLFVALIQLALALHVRNVLIDSAAEGARFGALAGNEPSHAVAKTRSLITMSIDPRYAAHVTATREETDGIPILSVTVRAPLPLVWLYGPPRVLTVAARAVDEERL